MHKYKFIICAAIINIILIDYHLSSQPPLNTDGTPSESVADVLVRGDDFLLSYFYTRLTSL